jgi:hypothetical protein
MVRSPTYPNCLCFWEIHIKFDALKFDRIARDVFAPVYPAIAEQIIVRTGVVRGVCLDIGCGGGYLGLGTGP